MSLLSSKFFINDWFLVISLLLVYGLIWYLPRAFPLSVTVLISLLSLSLAKGLDNTIGMKPYDVYDTNYFQGFDFSDFMVWLMYPPSGYLFIYVFHTWKIRGFVIPVFLLFTSLLGTAYEGVAVTFGVYQYKNWSIDYSYLIYLIVQIVTILFFQAVKKEVLRLRSNQH